MIKQRLLALFEQEDLEALWTQLLTAMQTCGFLAERDLESPIGDLQTPRL